LEGEKNRETWGSPQREGRTDGAANVVKVKEQIKGL